MGQKNLVVFDWDGTLCNSLPRIVASIGLAAEEQGIPCPSVAESQSIIGLGLVEALRQLFPEADATLVSALRDSYSRQYMALDAAPSALYPQAMEVMTQLKMDGCLLAVATGKSRKGLNRVLEGHNLAAFFDATICADETDSKPSPKMLYKLLSTLDVSAGSACMVGDTSFDLEMAQRAGVGSVGVSYGAHPVSVLLRYRSLGIIDGLAELPTLLPW